MTPPRLILASLALAFAVEPQLATACHCPAPTTVCAAVDYADLVFSGQVVATYPFHFDPAKWRAFVTRDREIDKFQDPDAVPFTLLRDHWADSVVEPFRSRALAARDRAELERISTEALQHGFRMTFRVHDVYKGPITSGARQDIWSDISSCGVLFAPHDFAIVYASRDHDGRMRIEQCYARNGLLREAGTDLPYLHSRKYGDPNSTRVFGFVAPKDRPKNRVERVTVALESDTYTSGAETDEHGEFIVDGVPPGTYLLTATPPVGPPTSFTISVAPNKCLEQPVFLESTQSKPPK